MMATGRPNGRPAGAEVMDRERRAALSHNGREAARARHGDENGELRIERLAKLLSRTRDGLTQREVSDVLAVSMTAAGNLIAKLRQELLATPYVLVGFRRSKRERLAYRIEERGKGGAG